MNAARVVPLNSLMLNNTVKVYINKNFRAICHESSVRSFAEGSQEALWGQDVVGHFFTRSADLAARCKNALGAEFARLKCLLSRPHWRSLREIRHRLASKLASSNRPSLVRHSKASCVVCTADLRLRKLFYRDGARTLQPTGSSRGSGRGRQ